MPIDYRNVSIVNFAWGQKVVPAGWLPAAERLELRHYKWLLVIKCVGVSDRGYIRHGYWGSAEEMSSQEWTDSAYQ